MLLSPKSHDYTKKRNFYRFNCLGVRLIQFLWYMTPYVVLWLKPFGFGNTAGGFICFGLDIVLSAFPVL